MKIKPSYGKTPEWMLTAVLIGIYILALHASTDIPRGGW